MVSRASLSQTVDVDTPELVVLSYTIAGVGSRASAALIDYAICVISVLALFLFTAYLGGLATTADQALRSFSFTFTLYALIQFVVLWLYYVLFEALADGQTPGKRTMRLRVVRDGGLAITFESSAIRNLVRIVDLQPGFFYAVGLISLVVNTKGKRLGDLAAGTIVVKEDVIRRRALVREPRATERLPELPRVYASKLAEAEYSALDRFVQRRMEFDAARRNTLATALAARLTSALDADSTQPIVTQLVRLHESELAARTQGIASRHDTGAAREKYAIIATNAPRWAAFADTLKRAQQKGLKKLSETEVRDFVREYRELGSDLARLRTATRGSDSADVFYLNRLVAGAHSLLYRRRTITVQRVVDFLFGEVPREIRRSYRPVLLSALLLFGPAFVAARAIVLHPELAPSMLPHEMLARAEQGVKNFKSGKGGYIDEPEILRPFMASRIITNNIQVTFMAFAMGMTAGIFTVVALVSNGVSIGLVLGLYMSKGIANLLYAFIAPHGVLELFAIVIAGGGGFLLAAAILVPGERTRRAALAENGRRAIKLLAGAAFLLVFAGSLEGFVSPINTWPLRYKLDVSAVTAVLLVAYLFPYATARAKFSAMRNGNDSDVAMDTHVPALAVAQRLPTARLGS